MRYSFALASLVMRYAQLGFRFKAIANCFKKKGNKKKERKKERRKEGKKERKEKKAA